MVCTPARAAKAGWCLRFRDGANGTGYHVPACTGAGTVSETGETEAVLLLLYKPWGASKDKALSVISKVADAFLNLPAMRVGKMDTAKNHIDAARFPNVDEYAAEPRVFLLAGAAVHADTRRAELRSEDHGSRGPRAQQHAVDLLAHGYHPAACLAVKHRPVHHTVTECETHALAHAHTKHSVHGCVGGVSKVV